MNGQLTAQGAKSKDKKKPVIDKEEVESLERALAELRSLSATLSSANSEDGDDGDDNDDKDKQIKDARAKKKGGGKVAANDQQKTVSEKSVSEKKSTETTSGNLTAAESARNHSASAAGSSSYPRHFFRLPLKTVVFIILHALLSLQNLNVHVGGDTSNASHGDHSSRVIRFSVCPSSSVAGGKEIAVLDTSAQFPTNAYLAFQLLPEYLVGLFFSPSADAGRIFSTRVGEGSRSSSFISISTVETMSNTVIQFAINLLESLRDVIVVIKDKGIDDGREEQTGGARRHQPPSSSSTSIRAARKLVGRWLDDQIDGLRSLLRMNKLNSEEEKEDTVEVDKMAPAAFTAEQQIASEDDDVNEKTKKKTAEIGEAQQLNVPPNADSSPPQPRAIIVLAPFLEPMTVAIIAAIISGVLCFIYDCALIAQQKVRTKRKEKKNNSDAAKHEEVSGVTASPFVAIILAALRTLLLTIPLYIAQALVLVYVFVGILNNAAIIANGPEDRFVFLARSLIMC